MIGKPVSDKTTFTPVELPDASSLPARKGGGLDDTLSLISDVQVKLEFVMGEATLSVAQLSALSAGDAVKLDEDQGSRVTLRLNGVDVGYGMLVTVDGALGVQIKHIER